MKNALPLAALISATFSPLILAAPQLPVLIPASSWRVASDPSAHVHTRVRVLVTKDATSANETQINTPQSVRSVYSLPASGGTGAIAIVDAYHFPTAQHDFNSFAQQYGLPQEKSRNSNASSNKNFEVVYANGRKPASGGEYIESWNLEEALDIEWAHAIAPNAKIYLVEAASDSMNDLLYAVQVASALSGVHEVSMSWGGDEAYYETQYDHVFSRPGVTFFAAGGDEADQLEYPSASPNVLSVGGTTLNRDSYGNLTSETGWSDTGCGISQYEERPAFQNAVQSDVGSYRGANDISFLADPNTGVGVYDSTPLYGESGWWIVGGTSLATPCWAGVANLAIQTNGAAASTLAEGNRLYANLGQPTFRDITSGQANDVRCAPGWDQLTGLGSPIGLMGK